MKELGRKHISKQSFPRGKLEELARQMLTAQRAGTGVASGLKAVVWYWSRSVLTSLPQALVAVPAFMFVSTFRALLPLALGFAAGCMVWMVFAELLPDALENASHAKVPLILCSLIVLSKVELIAPSEYTSLLRLDDQKQCLSAM